MILQHRAGGPGYTCPSGCWPEKDSSGRVTCNCDYQVHGAGLGAQYGLGAPINADQVQHALAQAAPILAKTSKWVNQGASVAPRVVPVLRKLVPLLALAPSLAPLVRAISADAAKIFAEAPQHTKTINEAIDLIASAPALAQQIAGPLNSLAAMVTRASTDPALKIVIARLNTIIELGKGKPGLPGAPGAGFSLGALVKPLDLYIYTRRHPWVLWATPLTLAGIIGGVGFALGRVSKRQRS